MSLSSGIDEGCPSWYLYRGGKNLGRHSSAAGDGGFSGTGCRTSGIFSTIGDRRAIVYGVRDFSEIFRKGHIGNLHVSLAPPPRTGYVLIIKFMVNQ